MKKFTGNNGMTLIELLVVISLVGIISIIAVPQYARFVAKNKVREAATELLQNMRLARTMAIKENRQYIITFNTGANTYSIGFDNNADNAPDGFETGPARVVNLQNEYGANIVFGTGTANGPDQSNLCPNCIGIGGSTVAFGAVTPLTIAFNPNGTVSDTGDAFITHNNRNFTFMVRVSFQSGKFDLWKWDGDSEIPAPPVVVNCNGAAPPIRYCAWTEAR